MKAAARLVSTYTMALLVVACLCLTGCGPREPDDGKVHLVLAMPQDSKTREMYRAIIDDFEQRYPHIAVELLGVSGDNYYSKVLVMIAGRNAPDLMWMGQAFGEFAARGIFLDLSDRIAAEIELDEFLPQALKWYQVKGKQYGIPFGIDMGFIAYNKELLDQAGVPYPTDDWDVDDFLAKAKKLTIDRDGDGRTDQYGYRGSLPESSFGAHIISDDGMRPLCNSPEMIESMKFNLELATKHKVSPHPEDADVESLDNISYFHQGRAAMMRLFTWDLPFLDAKCGDISWDIVTNPKVRQRGHWASSQAILVSADTKHPEEAWLLCKEFFGDRIQLAMGARGLPSNRRIAQEMIGRRKGMQPENWAAMLKASDCLYPTPRIANLYEILNLWYSAASGVSAGRTTPEAAVAKAEKAINRFIKYRRR